MAEIVEVGRYEGRNRDRISLDRGGVKSAYGRYPDKLIASYKDGRIVLEDPMQGSQVTRP
jgi:hypothetical protein